MTPEPAPASASPFQSRTDRVRTSSRHAIGLLQVDWVSGNHGANGLGVIFIPPQHEDKKPFIIAKVVDDRRNMKEIVVGYLAPQAAGRTWYPYSFLAPIAQNEGGIDSAFGVVSRLIEPCTRMA